jgi:hypothetical protein
VMAKKNADPRERVNADFEWVRGVYFARNSQPVNKKMVVALNVRLVFVVEVFAPP